MGAKVAERDDVALCAQVRDGDTAAFELVYRRHIGWTREYATRRVGAELAEDVVAETFAALLSALRCGQGPVGPVEPYLTTALRRQIARLLGPGDRLVHTGELSDLLEPDSPTLRGPSPEEEALERFDERTASAAFRALRPRDQRVLQLIELDQLSYEEAAQRLGVPTGTLGHMLFIAREALYDAWVAEHIPRVSESHPDNLDLARYLTGTAGARIRRRVSGHLEDCAACGLRIGDLGTATRRPARRASAWGVLAVLPVWYQLWTRSRAARGKYLFAGRPPVELLVPGLGLVLAAAVLSGVPNPASHEPGGTGSGDDTAVSAPVVAGAQNGSAGSATVSAGWEPGSSLAGVAAGEDVTLRFRLHAAGDWSEAVSLTITAGPGVTIDPRYRSCTAAGTSLTCSWIGPLRDGEELVGQVVVRVDDPALAALPTLTVGT